MHRSDLSPRSLLASAAVMLLSALLAGGGRMNVRPIPAHRRIVDPHG